MMKSHFSAGSEVPDGVLIQLTHCTSTYGTTKIGQLTDIITLGYLLLAG